MHQNHRNPSENERHDKMKRRGQDERWSRQPVVKTRTRQNVVKMTKALVVRMNRSTRTRNPHAGRGSIRASRSDWRTFSPNICKWTATLTMQRRSQRNILTPTRTETSKAKKKKAPLADTTANTDHQSKGEFD